MPSSTPSWNCRIDWRPSRWLVLALILLGLLAAASVLACALPWALKAPAAALALVEGLRLARREARRPAWRLSWPGGEAPARLDGSGGNRMLAEVRLVLRGPMAVLSGRDGAGRRQHLAWWPDTLPVPSRRQLRLAAAVGRRPDKPLPPVAA